MIMFDPKDVIVLIDRCEGCYLIDPGSSFSFTSNIRKDEDEVMK